MHGLLHISASTNRNRLIRGCCQSLRAASLHHVNLHRSDARLVSYTFSIFDVNSVFYNTLHPAKARSWPDEHLGDRCLLPFLDKNLALLLAKMGVYFVLFCWGQKPWNDSNVGTPEKGGRYTGGTTSNWHVWVFTTSNLCFNYGLSRPRSPNNFVCCVRVRLHGNKYEYLYNRKLKGLGVWIIFSKIYDI